MVVDSSRINKICILSDTHGRFESSVYSCIIGNYNTDQIYESIIITENETLINKFNSEKSALDYQNPSCIVHAGDIGSQQIVDELESICYLKAVSGNCDFNDYRTIEGQVKDFEYFNFNDVSIAVAHVPQDLDSAINGSFMRPAKINSTAKKPQLMIHGHTHISYIEKNNEDEVYICPGSATMGRGGTPNSIACVYICNGKLIAAELIEV